eukprot:18702-Rhodomonas_salina.3
MARAAGRDAMESMLTVHEDAIQSFLPLVCPTPDVSQHSHAEPMVGSDESPTLWITWGAECRASVVVVACRVTFHLSPACIDTCIVSDVNCGSWRRGQAAEATAQFEGSADKVIAAAIAVISGHTKVRPALRLRTRTSSNAILLHPTRDINQTPPHNQMLLIFIQLERTRSRSVHFHPDPSIRTPISLNSSPF